MSKGSPVSAVDAVIATIVVFGLLTVLALLIVRDLIHLGKEPDEAEPLLDDLDADVLRAAVARLYPRDNKRVERLPHADRNGHAGA
jgi:hypothetical protein